MIALLLALLSLAVWLTLTFARGGFWQARETDDRLPVISDAAAARLRVTAIVPARNEADVIAKSVSSLLAQNCAAIFDVIVVDDQSDDDTGALALAAANLFPPALAAKLTVLRGENPPPGWTGKINAMRYGLAHVDAREQKPDYILFTDADIAHAPDVLSRLLGGAVAENRTLVSLMAQLACVSRAEHWLVPAFIYFFDMLYPFSWVNNPRKKTAAAAGGCMLVRRDALRQAGGLEVIRDALIDDCALGAAMKKTGPIWLGLTHRTISLRPYPHFADIQQMVTRSAYAELRYSPLRLVGATLGMGLTFLAPPYFATYADMAVGLPALIAYCLMVLTYRPMLKRYGLGAWRGLFLPVIAGLYMIFTLQSALAYYRGKGGAWKGRYQAPLSTPPSQQ